VLREAEVERPVESDPHLLLEARQLAQVDRPPEPPRDESREPDAEDLRHARPPPDGGELPERGEAEGLFRSAERGDDVPCGGSALAERVPGRRRMEATRAWIRYQRAVAERPHARPIRHFEKLVHDDAATTLRNRQRRDQGVRRRARRPDERARPDRPPVA